MTVAEAKKDLRAEALRRLRELAPERDRVSAVVVGHLADSAVWRDATCAMAYLALPSEVSVDALWGLCPRPRLAAPRVDWRGGRMEPAELEGIDSGVHTVACGVREPDGEAPGLSPDDLDLVLAPGLAFDAEGRRLGRGGGFYDRFLAGLSRATRIGVCWSGQIVDRVPACDHDQRVHMLLTEKGLRPCGGAATG